MTEPAHISIDDLSLDYRTDAGATVHALDQISLDVTGPSIVTIVGPSGCGKTTLLRLIAGYLEPTSGTVRVGETQVTGPSPERGVVFQQPNLFEWWTVQRNVEAGPRYRGMGKAEAARTARHYLELVGLHDFEHAKPYELSGGMKQRCQIARVLANEPSIMLMDEPFGALDSFTRRQLQADLLRLHHARRDTIVFITHSVEEAVYLGDLVVVMSPRPGRIVHLENVPSYSGYGDESIDVLRTYEEFSRRVLEITQILERESVSAPSRSTAHAADPRD